MILYILMMVNVGFKKNRLTVFRRSGAVCAGYYRAGAFDSQMKKAVGYQGFK
jgi:hypothetical protein